MPLTPRRIGLLFVLEAVAIALLILGLVDLRLHQRDSDRAVNQWGYRGEARAQKGAGEIRIAVVGGSAAFEVGSPLSDTFAMNLFTEIQTATMLTNQGYSLVNLAAPHVGADSYPNTLRHYRFLDPDIICIFDGYDTLSGLPPFAREHSPFFRITGYLLMLPRRLLGLPGWMSDLDGGVADALRDDAGGASDVTCAGSSRAYCAAMTETVRVALQELHLPIVVVSPPAVSSRHLQQQRSLGTLLQESFGRDARFRYLDLTTEVDMKDPKNSRDGVRRTLVGDHQTAVRTAETMLKWLAAGWRRG